MNPLISVIVPCYNQAQYLDECLQSVLDQTYENWECIIVNDGSPDHTEEVALRWAAKDTRFAYLKKENGGLSSARNAGIEVAQGEWILPLDCDDKIGPQYLELAAREFGKGYTVIYCEAEYFGDRTGKWDLPEYMYENILRRNIIFCSAFFERKNWFTAGGYDIKMIYGLEDWSFWLSIIDKESKIKQIDEVLFYYRVKKNSMVHQLFANDKYRRMHKIIYENHHEKFIEQFGTYHEILKYYLNEKDQKAKLLSSKRFKIANKIANILEKFKLT